MTTTSPDRELIADYAARGSESAFRMLVARHVDLVYGTALRQLGDPWMAEETTQNVFLALARKSPRLMGVETIAGWLHRCTILESKARLRTELRRRRREEIAAELSVPLQEGDSPLAALVPLVDEALMHLRESDRLALMLRFFEDRSLRDVGQVLGVDEDAARKRVSRALDRVTDFFRARGFASSSTTGAMVLANASKAAPAGLAAAAANAGLASGGFGGMGVVILHLMALTKTQTILICAAMVAAPLAFQWQAEAKLSREQQLADTRLAKTQQQLGDLQTELGRTRDAVVKSQADSLTSQARLAALTNRAHPLPLQPYHWDDNVPLARVPKQFLQRLDISPTKNKRSELSEPVKEVLQLTEGETSRVQGIMDRFLHDYESAQAQKIHAIAASEVNSNGHPPEEIRAFSMPSLGEQYISLRQEFFGDLSGVLGEERFGIFKNLLSGWMRAGDDSGGFNSGMAVMDIDHKEAFYKPRPGDKCLGWGVMNEKGSMITAVRPEEIPDYLRPQLQDWINIAMSPAEGGKQ